MNIPAEAVEAAARVIYHTSGRSRQMPYSEAKPACKEEALQILEAAAPYMLAEAWKGGHEAGYIDGFDGSGITPNPYGPTE